MPLGDRRPELRHQVEHDVELGRLVDLFVERRAGNASDLEEGIRRNALVLSAGNQLRHVGTPVERVQSRRLALEILHLGVITGEQEDMVGTQDHALRPSVKVRLYLADNTAQLAKRMLLPRSENRSNGHGANTPVIERSRALAWTRSPSHRAGSSTTPPRHIAALNCRRPRSRATTFGRVTYHIRSRRYGRAQRLISPIPRRHR